MTTGILTLIAVIGFVITGGLYGIYLRKLDSDGAPIPLFVIYGYIIIYVIWYIVYHITKDIIINFNTPLS